MKLKPILFNTEMVQAILDGRKTATRRVIKLQPVCSYPRDCGCTIWDHGKTDDACDVECLGLDVGKKIYQTGDTIYIRETWDYLEGWKLKDPGVKGKYFYRADGDFRPVGWRGNWQASTHMPKEAARIWLQVTDVKVERLNDMTIKDCEKEGILCGNNGDIFAYIKRWDSALKKSDREKYGWAANPWVWVIEFERSENPEVDNGK